MTIHVSIKGALGRERTGVENYIRELLKSWCEVSLSDLDFVCYYKEKPEDDPLFLELKDRDFFRLKQVKLSYLWTQLGLSWELLKERLTQDKEQDKREEERVLFVPAHVLPFYCGMPAVVTVHGLEYERFPEFYSTLHWWYLRLMTKLSCSRAEKIIAVSESTKEDLVEFYDVDEDKISVVYHGVETPPMSTDEQASLSRPSPINTDQEELTQNKYILYLGRVELKKNILNIIKAFEITKQTLNKRYTKLSQNKEHETNTKSNNNTDSHRLPQKVRGNRCKSASKALSPRESASIYRDLKLVLAGGKGYGYGKIQETIDNSSLTEDIVTMGYVSEEEKWELLENADVFCFATCYEGFGLPILEAQTVGTPVVAGSRGASAEIASPSAVLVDPESPEEIAERLKRVLVDEDFRGELVKSGRKNVERFDWNRCGQKTLGVLKRVAGVE